LIIKCGLCGWLVVMAAILLHPVATVDRGGESPLRKSFGDGKVERDATTRHIDLCKDGKVRGKVVWRGGVADEQEWRGLQGKACAMP